jgi:hypothetical protein
MPSFGALGNVFPVFATATLPPVVRSFLPSAGLADKVCPEIVNELNIDWFSERYTFRRGRSDVPAFHGCDHARDAAAFLDNCVSIFFVLGRWSLALVKAKNDDY